VDLLPIASLSKYPAETINAVRAWGQQCEDSKTYQGMAYFCRFQVRLEVGTITAMGRWQSCLKLKSTKRAHAVLAVLMSWGNLIQHFIVLSKLKHTLHLEFLKSGPKRSSK
jgi:hypothetical protein